MRYCHRHEPRKSMSTRFLCMPSLWSWGNEPQMSTGRGKAHQQSTADEGFPAAQLVHQRTEAMWGRLTLLRCPGPGVATPVAHFAPASQTNCECGLSTQSNFVGVTAVWAMAVSSSLCLIVISVSSGGSVAQWSKGRATRLGRLPLVLLDNTAPVRPFSQSAPRRRLITQTTPSPAFHRQVSIDNGA